MALGITNRIRLGMASPSGAPKGGNVKTAKDTNKTQKTANPQMKESGGGIHTIKEKAEY